MLRFLVAEIAWSALRLWCLLAGMQRDSVLAWLQVLERPYMLLQIELCGLLSRDRMIDLHIERTEFWQACCLVRVPCRFACAHSL